MDRHLVDAESVTLLWYESQEKIKHATLMAGSTVTFSDVELYRMRRTQCSFVYDPALHEIATRDMADLIALDDDAHSMATQSVMDLFATTDTVPIAPYASRVYHLLAHSLI